MSELVLKYALDLTGTSPEHRILNEQHTLAPGTNRAVVTRYGAFYTDQLIVRDELNGHVLTINDQYVPVMYYEEPSERSGKEVCTAIIITDGTVSDTVSVDYQVVGGPYVNISAVIIDLIENLNLDERSVAYGDLLGVPNAFPPTEHLHPIGDIYGFEYVTEAIERVRQAILIGDEESHEELRQQIESRYQNSLDAVQVLKDQVDDHEARTDNPHSVTKTQVGLSNVENLPLSSKTDAEQGEVHTRYMTPIRTKEAIDFQLGNVTRAHMANTNNPHGVTKDQVGLGNVDNFSRSDYDTRYLRRDGGNNYASNTLEIASPSSLFTLNSNVTVRNRVNTVNVLDLESGRVLTYRNIVPNQNNAIDLGTSVLSFRNLYAQFVRGDGQHITNLNASQLLSGTVPPARLPLVTTEVAGAMSSTDKTKLDGIANNANNYTHPSQTAIDANAVDNGVNVIDRIQVNAQGHVTSVTMRNLSAATQSAAGVMSSTDKTKLDNIDDNANNYVHPSYTERTVELINSTNRIEILASLESDALGHIVGAEKYILDTTESRTNNSKDVLLQAKAMRDHATSGDHDNRYLMVNSTTSQQKVTQIPDFANGIRMNKLMTVSLIDQIGSLSANERTHVFTFQPAISDQHENYTFKGRIIGSMSNNVGEVEFTIHLRVNELNATSAATWYFNRLSNGSSSINLTPIVHLGSLHSDSNAKRRMIVSVVTNTALHGLSGTMDIYSRHPLAIDSVDVFRLKLSIPIGPTLSGWSNTSPYPSDHVLVSPTKGQINGMHLSIATDEMVAQGTDNTHPISSRHLASALAGYTVENGHILYPNPKGGVMYFASRTSSYYSGNIKDLIPEFSNSENKYIYILNPASRNAVVNGTDIGTQALSSFDIEINTDYINWSTMKRTYKHGRWNVFRIATNWNDGYRADIRAIKGDIVKPIKASYGRATASSDRRNITGNMEVDVLRFEIPVLPLDPSDWRVVSGTPSLPSNGIGVSSDDQYVYIAHNGGNRFTVVRKSDWSVVSGTPLLPNTGHGVATDDTYVYLGHWGGNGFTVVRKSDWSVVSETPSLPSIGYGVATDDQYVYIAHSGGNNFTVVRKSDWSVVSGTPSLPGTGWGVTTDDQYVYLAHSSGNYFTVVRKSDWSVVSETPTLPNTGWGVTADDEYVYIAHNGGRFFTVVRKSDWSVVSGTPSLPGTGRGVTTDDQYVYLAHATAPFFTVIRKGLSPTNLSVTVSNLKISTPYLNEFFGAKMFGQSDQVNEERKNALINILSDNWVIYSAGDIPFDGLSYSLPQGGNYVTHPSSVIWDTETSLPQSPVNFIYTNQIPGPDDGADGDVYYVVGD